MLGGGVLDTQGCLQAVDHGQQAFCKALDAELAGLGHVFIGPAAGVFHIGLGAHVLVGQFGILGL
ncbi:hypothetical protein D3C72_2158390 [compost metagenome]